MVGLNMEIQTKNSDLLILVDIIYDRIVYCVKFDTSVSANKRCKPH